MTMAVLREKLGAIADLVDRQQVTMLQGVGRDYAKTIREAIAALSAQGEPVEWQYLDGDGDWMGTACPNVWREAGHEVRALYLHPAPPGSDAVTEAGTLLDALATVNRLNNLGDAVYDVRARVDMSGIEGSSWDHPEVKAYSDAVEIIDAALAARTGKGEANGR